MVDFETVLFEYLDASSALKTLIGSNLFCEQIHNFDGATEKGILFRFRAGSSNEFIPVHDLLCDIHCYGDTGESSRAVYRALHDRLHGITNTDTSGGFIIKANEAVTGQTIIEPDTKWTKVLTTYSISIR